MPIVHRPPTALVSAAALAAAATLSAPAPVRADPPAPPGTLELVAAFDASQLEAPESVAVDLDGSLYVSLALTGEIRKIAPDGSQSTHALLPVGPPLTPCGAFIGIMGALALDPHGNLYATLSACDPDDRGIWKITPEGDAARLAALPPSALPNGVAYRAGDVYVADSELGVIWRAPADGSGPAEVWADDPLLEPSPGHVFPGPNGLQFFHDEIYVANSDQFTILAIPVTGGEAGPARVHAAGIGCDDFAFDVHGSLYCTTDPFNTVVRVDPDGSLEVLLTAADGLDGPSATAFGRTAGDNQDLYITNAAFPFFSTTHTPKLLKLSLDVPGMPR
jgi:sugar lactone lactonase YvrE